MKRLVVFAACLAAPGWAAAQAIAPAPLKHAEITFGLIEGDVYAAKNSFVVKAELAKGAATHEH